MNVIKKIEEIDEDTYQQIIKLLDTGLSLKTICVNFGLEDHYRMIQSHLNHKGIHSHHSKQYKQAIKEKYLLEIIRLYCEEYKNLKEIGDIYNLSPSTVRDWLKEENINIRPMYVSKKKHSLNAEYFDKINICVKAYILGFMAADGYVTDKNGIGMGLKLDDIDVLYFLKNQLGASNKIRIDKREHPRAIFQVESKYMASSLKELGIIPRKTYKLDPNAILQKANIIKNTKLEYAFLLGYFDGDGGINHYIPSEEVRRTKHYGEMFSLSVTGTKETCQYYKDFAKVGWMYQRHPERPINNWTFSISGRNQCKKLLNPLYSVKDDIGFCLKRKYELYKML